MGDYTGREKKHPKNPDQHRLIRPVSGHPETRKAPGIRGIFGGYAAACDLGSSRNPEVLRIEVIGLQGALLLRQSWRGHFFLPLATGLHPCCETGYSAQSLTKRTDVMGLPKARGYDRSFELAALERLAAGERVSGVRLKPTSLRQTRGGS